MLNLELFFNKKDISTYEKIDNFIETVMDIQKRKEKKCFIYSDDGRKATIELLDTGKYKFIYITEDKSFENEYNSLIEIYKTNEFNDILNFILKERKNNVN